MTVAAPVNLADWIGRTEEVSEFLSPFPARALAALLDRDPESAGAGELAPLEHWLHLLPLHRQSELAPDGHSHRGGFMPPVPLPRRMFAGAKISFLRPLILGSRAKRTGRIVDITSKEGRSGPLTFVKVRQEISTAEGLALVEDQDIVYRTHPGQPEPGPGQVLTGSEPGWRADPIQRDLSTPAVQLPTSGGPKLDNPDWTEVVRPDIWMLLRYSALIFNAHRIHYDYLYATQVEHYPGLIVHGQLIATLLADLARRRAGPLASFSFRSQAALYEDRPVTLLGNRKGDMIELAAADETGRVAMTAEAQVRGQI